LGESSRASIPAFAHSRSSRRSFRASSGIRCAAVALLAVLGPLGCKTRPDQPWRPGAPRPRRAFCPQFAASIRPNSPRRTCLWCGWAQPTQSDTGRRLRYWFPFGERVGCSRFRPIPDCLGIPAAQEANCSAAGKRPPRWVPISASSSCAAYTSTPGILPQPVQRRRVLFHRPSQSRIDLQDLPPQQLHLGPLC